jgi:hypothetical protein
MDKQVVIDELFKRPSFARLFVAGFIYGVV